MLVRDSGGGCLGGRNGRRFGQEPLHAGIFRSGEVTKFLMVNSRNEEERANAFAQKGPRYPRCRAPLAMVVRGMWMDGKYQ